jgi:hypothetical protein
MKSGHKAATLNHISLLTPSSTEWSVDAVGILPQSLMPLSTSSSSNAESAVLVASRYGAWSLIGKRERDSSQHGKMVLFVWYSSPTASVKERALQKQVLKLSHPHLSTFESSSGRSSSSSSSVDPPPLVQLATSPTKPEEVYVYVANVVSGRILTWKLSRPDLSRVLAPPPAAVTWLDELQSVEEGAETLTSLSATWNSGMTTPFLLVGTSAGHVYSLQQTHVPLAIQVQRVATSSLFGSINNNSNGLWGSILHSMIPASRSAATGDAVVTTLLHPPDDASSSSNYTQGMFHVLTKSGRLQGWRTHKPTESPHWIFEAGPKPIDLVALLHDKIKAPAVRSLRVLQAAISPQGHHIHLLVLTEHDDDEYRLYWSVLTMEGGHGDFAKEEPTLTLTTAHWLDRFYDPRSVTVVGLIVAANNTAYAAFQSPGSAPIAMALCGRDNTFDAIHECDLPVGNIPALIVDTMVPDKVVYGCAVWSISGANVRIQYRPTTASPAPSTVPHGSTSRSRSAIATLTTHLQSAFWNYYQHPDRSVRLPPSLISANIADLQEAVVGVGCALASRQQALSNVLEWHLAFLNLLQLSGLYRSLPEVTQWQLLAIGQELTVADRLGSLPSDMSTRIPSWQLEALESRPWQGLGPWFGDLVAKHYGAGQDRQQALVEWLVAMLETAEGYREEHGQKTYYLTSGSRIPKMSRIEEVPIWTSQIALQRTLLGLLESWHDGGFVGHGGQAVVLATGILQSFGDTYASVPTEETQSTYANAQRMTIGLLRRQINPPNDVVAFRLSVKHHSFKGVCQIAFDHEKKEDAEEFSVVPLFTELAHAKDISTSMLFPAFFLYWHSQRQHFGHVLDYGQYCPDTFRAFLESSEELRPYRWIQAARAGDFEGVTNSLLRNAEKPEILLHDAHLSLSLAKLANSVVESESMDKELAEKRARHIDQKRELVNAQNELFDETAPSSCLWSAERLLNYAYDRANQAKDAEDKCRIYFTALAICATMEEIDQVEKNASHVWFRVLQTELDWWNNLIQSATDLTDTDILRTVKQATLFGGLQTYCLDCQDDQSWQHVLYSDRIEHQVLESFGMEFSAPMRRVLRSVVTFMQKS